MKENVKKLIDLGQLEITMGGWVGQDESTPNYEDMMNNFFMGHQWLKKEFNLWQDMSSYDIDFELVRNNDA